MINPLAKEFTFFSLIKFAAPTIVMMLFSSLYIMADGVFVSRFVSTDALSAVNIVCPLYNIIFAVAIMLASGGSALVAKQMGENKTEQAKSNFTLIISVSIIFSVLFAAGCIYFIKPIIYCLGSNDTIYPYCYDYIVPILCFIPLCMLQILFQSFLIAAGKPSMGLLIAIIGGSANIIFDYIFIVVMSMGVIGAAYGTIVGFILQASVGIVYFALKRKGTIYFIKPKFNKFAIIKSCTNGASEMIGNLSVSVTTFLFNITMMKYLGIDGVAAITIVLYAEYMLTSIFFGYASGVAPVFSYNYGSKNINRLKKVFKISLTFIIVCSIAIYFISLPASSAIINIFAKQGTNVFDISLKGFCIFAISFFFTGTNIFSSAMFTAFSNGKVSAIISLLRTLVFLVFAILILPKFFGVNGIWFAVPFAEILSIAVSIFYFIKLKKIYNYI